jgi:molybdate transport system substrate-binding protein
MKRFVPGIIALLLLLSISFTASPARAQDLTISAAISLKNAFTDIAKAFEAANKGVTVSLNFGASGYLMTQIRGGAPVDVFASAALKDMDALDAGGLVVKDSRANFVSNAVVLIKPATSKTTLMTFEDLAKPDVKKIAIGNPRSVPAGRYADEVLHTLKLSDAIKDKLVFAENVRQVLDYVARNEVDAGIVYSTDAKTRLQDVVVIAAARESSHKPIVYPIAVVKGSKNEKVARDFIAFVKSAAGRTILEKYGFKPVK